MAIAPPTRRSRLPHADQPEPPLAVGRAGVETGPVIDDPQGDSRPRFRVKLDPGVPGAAVLDDVPQGFLRDAVEAQGRVVGNRRRHLAGGEFDRQAVGLGQFLAQAADGGHEPQLLELRRVQVVRQVMHGRRTVA